MSSQQKTVDYLLDQMGAAGQVSARKMFGEYGIYNEGKMIALVCDDQLFVKPTNAGRAFIGKPQEGSPYPNAKPHFRIPEEKWDDREWLSKLIEVTTPEVSLPRKKRGK